MARDTTPTNRRAYERPEIGDDWAQAWDDLVEDLDSASLYVDSTENTSATDPIPGTTHFEDVDAGSVNTEQASVTNETLVVLKKTTDQSLPANTQTTIDWDTEEKDITDSFNVSSNEFSPPESGYYFINYQVRFGVGSDGDILQMIFNELGGGSLLGAQTVAGGPNSVAARLSGIVELSSSSSYTFVAENATSSDAVVGRPERTYASINRVLIE